MAKVKLLDPADDKRLLDRYELIGEIASGGMATVYLARLGGVGGFQRFYAIKRLHPHLAKEQEFIEMFLDEARLAAGIHSPHVVPILEVGESERGYYLVMEYIEGDTLGRLVARTVAKGELVPQPVLVRILLDALTGLHAAHELRDPLGNPLELVHRDCSPQNILVGIDGTSRLTDFGVARASSRLSVTRTEQLKGKLAYMSPEQVKAEGEIDHRSDVFAMGVVLWEVLTGRRLFKAATETATMSRILFHPIPRLSSVLRDVHPAMDEACAKALSRDLETRFQSAAEMADALEDAAMQADGVATPREVAAYMQSILGEEIAAQKESMRAWLAANEPSVSMSRTAIRTHTRSPSPSSSEPQEPTPLAASADAQASLSKKRIPLLALLVFAMLAAGAIGAWLTLHKGASQTETEAKVAAPAPSPLATLAPPATAEPSALPATSTAAIEASASATAAPSPPAPTQKRPTAPPPRPRPTATGSKKPPSGGDDLANPYR